MLAADRKIGQTNLNIWRGILELVCTVVYLIPRTSVVGAILLTGYFGGAILATLRVGEPVFAQIGLGILIWDGLYPRDPPVTRQ